MAIAAIGSTERIRSGEASKGFEAGLPGFLGAHILGGLGLVRLTGPGQVGASARRVAGSRKQAEIFQLDFARFSA